jgi:hypothetical protein
VDRFVAAFNAHDLAALREIVCEDVRVELVGGNEMHGSADSEASEGRVDAIRCYCWCPDTLRVLADEIGVPANPRPYRSPTLAEFQAWLAAHHPR